MGTQKESQKVPIDVQSSCRCRKEDWSCPTTAEDEIDSNRGGTALLLADRRVYLALELVLPGHRR